MSILHHYNTPICIEQSSTERCGHVTTKPSNNKVSVIILQPEICQITQFQYGSIRIGSFPSHKFNTLQTLCTIIESNIYISAGPCNKRRFVLLVMNPPTQRTVAGLVHLANLTKPPSIPPSCCGSDRVGTKKSHQQQTEPSAESR